MFYRVQAAPMNISTVFAKANFLLPSQNPLAHPNIYHSSSNTPDGYHHIHRRTIRNLNRTTSPWQIFVSDMLIQEMEELLRPDMFDWADEMNQLDSPTASTFTICPSSPELTSSSGSDDGSCPGTPITVASSEPDNAAEIVEVEARGFVEEEYPVIVKVSTMSADDIDFGAVFGQVATTNLDEEITAVKPSNNQAKVHNRLLPPISSTLALDLASSSEDKNGLPLRDTSWLDLAISDTQSKQEWSAMQKSSLAGKPVLHRLNFSGGSVFHPSATSPETSLWAAYHFHRQAKYNLHLGRPGFENPISYKGVLIAQAAKLIDPFKYHGPQYALNHRGSKLQEAATGYVEKISAPFGT